MRERETLRSACIRRQGFRPGPRVESRAFAWGRGVLSTVYSHLPSLLRSREPLVCA